MTTTVLQTIILLLGIAICSASVLGIYSPSRLVKAVTTVGRKNSGIFVALTVRILLGAVLILVASDARIPVIFMAVGVLSILSAFIILLAGRDRIDLLMSWLERLTHMSLRLWLLLGIAFGGLLIYGIS